MNDNSVELSLQQTTTTTTRSTSRRQYQDDQQQTLDRQQYQLTFQTIKPITSHQLQNNLKCQTLGCKCSCFEAVKRHSDVNSRTCNKCQHGWVVHAMDKLGYPPAPLTTPTPAAATSGDQVNLNTVMDLAGLMLYGAQATPIRLKVLLDRLLSALPHDHVLLVLGAYGWTYEDYSRGYMLQDSFGRLLNNWSMATGDEEQLILAQFLRFTLTRQPAEKLLSQCLQQSADMSNTLPNTRKTSTTSDPPSIDVAADVTGVKMKQYLLLQEQIAAAALFDRLRLGYDQARQAALQAATCATDTASSLLFPYTPAPTYPYRSSSIVDYSLRSLHGGVAQPLLSGGGLFDPLKEFAEAARLQASFLEGKSPIKLPPAFDVHHAPSVPASPLTASRQNTKLPVTSIPQAFCSPLKTSCSNNSTVADNVKSSSADYNNSSTRLKRRSPAPPGLPVHSDKKPHHDRSSSSTHHATTTEGVINYSINKDTNQQHNSTKKKQADRSITPPQVPVSATQQSAVNLASRPPLPPGSVSRAAPGNASRPSTCSKRQAQPTPGYGGTLISPTGKRRVLCTACQKTFCDKGALKIHYSAVHLREMHRCTIAGCDMVFSSRRSRNRHSANPNPKLHSAEAAALVSGAAGRIMLENGLTGSPSPGTVYYGLQQTNNVAGSTEAIYHHDDDNVSSKYADDDQCSRSSCMSEDLESRADSEFDGDAAEHVGYPAVSENSSAEGDSNGKNEFQVEQLKTSSEVTGCVDYGKGSNGSSYGSSVVVSSKRKRSVPTRCVTSDGQSTVEQNIDNQSRCSEDSESDTEEHLTVKKRVVTCDNQCNAVDVRVRNGNETEGSKVENSELMVDDVEGDQPAAASSCRRNLIHSFGRNSEKQKTEDTRSGNAVDDKTSDSLKNGENGVCSSLPAKHSSVVNVNSKKATDHDENWNNCDCKMSSVDSGSSQPCCSDDDDVTTCAVDGPDEDEESTADGIVCCSTEEPRISSSSSCTTCGKLFDNDFIARIHEQNVHQRLLHICRVAGCNAAFLSKRSRDRHSSNHNLHRKLLSTNGPSSDDDVTAGLDEQKLRHIDVEGPPVNGCSPKHERQLGSCSPLKSSVDHERSCSQDSANSHFSDMNTSIHDTDPAMRDLADDDSLSGRQRTSSTCTDDLSPVTQDSSASQTAVVGGSVCHLCQQSFRDNLVLKEHLETVHPREMYPCTVDGCNKVFSTRKSRNRHSQNENLHRKLPAD